MNDINLEIVHEVNIRYWQRRLDRLTTGYLMFKSILYLVIPALLAWSLA